MAEGKYLEKNDLKAPGVNMGSKEKSKDFKETWLKLLKYCSKYGTDNCHNHYNPILSTIF